MFKKLKKMMKDTRGLSDSILTKAILSIILLVILFNVYAELIPTAQEAGNTLNSSSVPFGALFTSNGVVFIIIMAALLITVVTAFMKKSNK